MGRLEVLSKGLSNVLLDEKKYLCMNDLRYGHEHHKHHTYLFGIFLDGQLI